MSYTGSDAEFQHITTLRLKQMKRRGEKIACLTAYDAMTAGLLNEAGIDVILVGDSLGNIVQGHDTTIPVTIEDVIYHTKAVVKGANRPLIVADMPFMSYQVSPEEAFRNAGRIMKETGCNAIKLEGGKLCVDAIERLTEAGIPAMGHLGLTPQSINIFGSYRARGKKEDEAKKIYNDALMLEKAGAFAIVLEKIPAELGKKISEAISIPTIGIGAGPHCDGQILVYTDMLGLTVDFHPRFVRRYANLAEQIKSAVMTYSDDVKNREFPNNDESY